MRTAVVTGAGGFIGGALTRRLLDEGVKVYGVDISPLSLERFVGEPYFVPVCANLSAENLSKSINENIDVVFYLAWGGSLKGADLYDTDLQINNISTAVKTLKSMTEMCGHFVFFSSSYEAMKSEDDVPISIYGSAKKAAADMCASIASRKNIRFNKVILTNTFGLGDRSAKAVNALIHKMLLNESLALVEGNNKNDWVYIDDCIDGILSVTLKGKNFKEYYIGHRKVSTFKEKIIAMRNALCPAMELNFGGMEEKTFVDYSCFDIDALYNDTGFECRTDFREAVLKTAEWVKTMNWEVQ